MFHMAPPSSQKNPTAHAVHPFRPDLSSHQNFKKGGQHSSQRREVDDKNRISQSQVSTTNQHVDDTFRHHYLYQQRRSFSSISFFDSYSTGIDQILHYLLVVIYPKPSNSIDFFTLSKPYPYQIS